MTALWFLIGLVVGALAFLSQWLMVREIKPGMSTKTVLFFISGMLLRLGAIGAMFYFAIQRGILEAVASLVGLIISRWVCLLITNKRKATPSSEEIE